MGLSAASRPGFATVRGVLTAALVAFALAGVITVVALADHHRVEAANWDANQATWYCQHDGTRCDELQIEDLEGRWEHRELGYRISFFSLSSVGIAAVIVAFALAWKARRTARSRPSAESPGSS
jgi:H+/Cl- antiporter ClcA